MFFANLNVFIVVLAGAIYLFSWFRDLPVRMLIIPYGGGLGTFFGGHLIVALVLIAIWIKWGLAPSVCAPRREKGYLAGHLAVAVASIVLIGAIGLSLQAASISREDEYWYWLTMMFYIGPIAAIPAAIGLAMIFSAGAKRPRHALDETGSASVP